MKNNLVFVLLKQKSVVRCFQKKSIEFLGTNASSITSAKIFRVNLFYEQIDNSQFHL